MKDAITALREALAAPEPEPVAQKPRMTVLEAVLRANPLAMPPAAPAVPLTDEQIWSMWMSSEFRGNGGQVDWFCEGIRAAEAHHGITGGKP